MSKSSIIKKEGLNESEKILAKYCEQTFLNLWSYPNVQYQQKDKIIELCDLLIVFGETAIIISDKNIPFNDNKGLEIGWDRWYRKAITDSIKQINTAENRILRNPDKIIIDKNQKFPFELSSIRKIHRVVVANGVKESCKNHFNSNLGSLCIDSTRSEESSIFSVKYKNFDKFVHIFDEESFEIMINELDTINDVLQYLEKKEKLLAEKQIMCTGEEELLAKYLINMNESGEHDFNLEASPDVILFIPEGDWEELIKNPKYIDKKIIDKISYSWDDLISKSGKHLLDGTNINPFKQSFSDIEIIYRKMAEHTRFERRCIMQPIARGITQVNWNKGLSRYLNIFYAENKMRLYVFLFLDKPNDFSEGDYLEARRNMLLHSSIKASTLLKAQNKVVKEVIGIGSNSPIEKTSSEDFLYYDLKNIEEEQIKESLEMCEKLGIFTQKPKLNIEKANEFPQ